MVYCEKKKNNTTQARVRRAHTSSPRFYICVHIRRETYARIILISRLGQKQLRNSRGKVKYQASSVFQYAINHMKYNNFSTKIERKYEYK